MRTYWTIQSLEKWEEVKKLGYLTGNKKYIWPEFIDAYHWLMKKMSERILNYRGEYPIWFWTNRPDLRKSGHLNRGEQGVLLKVNIAENRVLLSDFQAWHIVLMKSYFDLEENVETDISLSQDEIEKSWELIFDIDYLAKHPNWGENDCSIQGVTGSLNLDEIVFVKKFTAK